jgi:DNA-(apurinic or apyrimidinic site) lyase
MSNNRPIDTQKEKLSQIFSEIPWGVWEKIVKKEPEWQNMEFFLPSYGFGPFAVLMVVTGLNDYQLKGKADVAYWPKIHKVLETSPPPSSPNELCSLLTPFYQNERLNKNKIERMERFLESPLCSILWKSHPKKVSEEFLNIWHELARTMNQDSSAKTIVFSMKCLGISLLMVGEYGFNFVPIPIPVDSRVMKFTNQLGFHITTADDVRRLWSDMLSILRKNDSRLNMIHLDSLVWQVASMSEYELRGYFRDLGISHLGDKLFALLQM